MPTPVISVGALELGGSGKTPVSMEVARRLLNSGLRVALLSRGYGRGDEALLHRRRLPDALVRCDRDRARLVAEVTPHCDAIVLDDAFQHRRCPRDLDILVRDPWSRRALLLREGLRGAKRANLIWWHRRDGGKADPPLWQSSLVEGPPPAIVSRFRPRTPDLLRGLRIYLLSGIARADAFYRLCVEMGAEVLGWSRFRDHHWFRPQEIDRTWSFARRIHADAVVTTEKDRVRITDPPEIPPLLVLQGDVEIIAGESFLRESLSRLCAK